MKLNAKRRRWIWGPLLMCVAWLTFFGDKESAAEVSISKAVVRSANPVSGGATPSTEMPRKAEPVLLALLPRNSLIPHVKSSPVDLFSTKNWTPPPPPVIEAPAPAPAAPPFPFVYAGKKQEAGQWEVYLTRSDMTFIVRQGTNMEGTYLVERIEPPSMTIRYLPLGQMQSLSVGE